jgi:hypothetical protein
VAAEPPAASSASSPVSPPPVIRTHFGGPTAGRVARSGKMLKSDYRAAAGVSCHHLRGSSSPRGLEKADILIDAERTALTLAVDVGSTIRTGNPILLDLLPMADILIHNLNETTSARSFTAHADSDRCRALRLQGRTRHSLGVVRRLRNAANVEGERRAACPTGRYVFLYMPSHPPSMLNRATCLPPHPLHHGAGSRNTA